MRAEPTDPTHYAEDRLLLHTGRIAVVFVGNALLTAVLVAVHLSGAPGWSFAAFLAMTVGMTWWAGAWSGLASAALGWLFVDGFILGRHAHLAWHGVADLTRVLLLLAVAVVVAVLRIVLIRLVSHLDREAFPDRPGERTATGGAPPATVPMARARRTAAAPPR